ncbi:MAG: signal peptidase I [Planctomycetes bacterium]|nr:signal peptidase I [Planctomycetota bacterium]
MAPTLLGEHMTLTCPQCGYTFTTGPRDYRSASEPLPIQGEAHNPIIAACPMCDFPIRHDSMRLNAGDRILVLKYPYAFFEPDRWDVVVFKNPENPDINYIKRLVGLPGEQLWIVNGNVYTKKLTPDGRVDHDEHAKWTIQRKPEKVQRAVWQPVYHSDYYPLDDGQGMKRDIGRQSLVWSEPWRGTGESEASWKFDKRGPRWTYDDSAGRPGVLTFAFEPTTMANYYAYNSVSGEGPIGSSTFEDMRLSASLSPRGAGLAATLTCSTHDTLMQGVIESDGKVRLQSRLIETPAGQAPTWTVRAEGAAAPLAVGRSTRVELWHVDQTLSLWVDGKQVAHWQYDDVDVERLAHTSIPRYAPVVGIEVRGAPVELRSVDLDRDLYYTQQGMGALATHDNPAMITADRFFCLGDNSPASSDGRLWSKVNDWVAYRTGVPAGFVPRDLMIGRAFFVYFPAPHRFSPSSMPLVPNFGKMRFIH